MRRHPVEALNVNLSVLIYVAARIVLMLVLVGFVRLPIVDPCPDTSTSSRATPLPVRSQPGRRLAPPNPAPSTSPAAHAEALPTTRRPTPHDPIDHNARPPPTRWGLVYLVATIQGALAASCGQDYRCPVTIRFIA